MGSVWSLCGIRGFLALLKASKNALELIFPSPKSLGPSKAEYLKRTEFLGFFGLIFKYTGGRPWYSSLRVPWILWRVV